MLKAIKENGNNPQCSHKWVKRDKKTITILERACTECGKLELHSEDIELSEQDVKKIMKVN